jgi:hypothetical protein
VTTQAVIASKAKQSPSRKKEIASSQKMLLAMTRAEQLQFRKGTEYASARRHKSFGSFTLAMDRQITALRNED